MSQPSHSSDTQQRTLLLLVKNLYDIQMLRLQAAGRHNRTTGPETQLAGGDIARLKVHSDRLEALESSAQKEVEAHLKTMPFYKEVLSDKDRFKGLGPVISAVILSSFDIHKADTVSKMWAFAGLRPMPCRRCKTCQTVLVEVDSLYEHVKTRVRMKDPTEAPKSALPKCPHAKGAISEAQTFESGKTQKPTKGEKLPYNAFLRAKLVGVLGTVLLRNKTPWRKFYDDYKHRKQTAGWGVSDGHRHNAAIRYMVKMLLLEVWKAWREYEGLEVRPSYHEEKQGGHQASNIETTSVGERASKGKTTKLHKRAKAIKTTSPIARATIDKTTTVTMRKCTTLQAKMNESTKRLKRA